jgi:hypothetical protein
MHRQLCMAYGTLVRYGYALCFLACAAGLARAQDPFEIHVYEYEILHSGHSIGFMELNARRPGNSLEYAGWRFLPHFYVPEGWHWPVQAGLVTEFSFQNTTYEENSRRVETRPILEKSFQKFQADFNPVFARPARPGNAGRMEL